MRVSALVALLAVALAALPVRAADDVSQAQIHFKRGVTLYEDGDFSAALVEFRRAYELVPHSRVLYNLARVAAAQHDHAAALSYYRRYLNDAGTQLTPQRRREVEDELQKLAGRVGQLRVLVDVAGAQVTVDDVPVGISPLEAPLVVNAGRRRVTATIAGAAPAARLVDVAGEEQVAVSLAIPLPATPALAPHRLAAPAPPPTARPLVTERATPTARPGRPWTAICWTATGLLAAGAGVAGALALRAESDLRRLRDDYPVSADELTRTRDRASTAARTTDALIAGAAVMAGISLWVTLSPSRDTAVSVGPTSVGLSGRF